MTYENRPMNAPRLAGAALRVAVFALEGPLGGAIISKSLKDMGVDKFRGEPVDAPSMPWPELPHHGHEWTGAAPALDAIARVQPASASKGFAFESALDVARAYRDGRTDPVKVAERLLANVAASDAQHPKMRIVIASLADDVMKQAREAKARLDAKQPRSLLDGVPVAVKDEVDMVPYPTTVGTRIFGKSAATSDAFSVAKLRAAGALLFCKTNMHEIGINPTGFNPHHGACRNPYDPGCDTGGSSSGVGAAVAAGFAPIGLGADGGGSIRVPAAHCGVFGLKPSFGRVSERGAAPIAWSVGHLGPIGATALDTAIGYAVMSGRDDHDIPSMRQPDVTIDGVVDGDVRGLKLGVYRPWFDDCDPGVRAACHRMLEVLVAKGATIVDIEIPELHKLQLAHILTIASEMRASQQRYLKEHGSEYSLNTRMIFALMGAVSSSDYVHAQRIRALFHARFTEILAKVDVIMTPTAGCTAPRYRDDAIAEGESDILLLDKIMRFVRPANFLGLPSISMPAGYDEAGLPVGLMATGRAWEESLLLRIARASEDGLERRAPKAHWRLIGS